VGATAQKPNNNPSTMSRSWPVLFPQDGPSVGDSIISRIDAGSFNLAAIGVYRMPYQVHGRRRAASNSQITATVLVETTVVNSILKLRALGAFTLTASAGGLYPVGATLLIEALL
jgi:hypothetical protein